MRDCGKFVTPESLAVSLLIVLFGLVVILYACVGDFTGLLVVGILVSAFALFLFYSSQAFNAVVHPKY